MIESQCICYSVKKLRELAYWQITIFKIIESQINS